MLPSQLTPSSFAAYPEVARRVAIDRIALLRRLPLGFVPLLLRELIVYDWKFPAERREIDAQFAYLASLPSDQLSKAMTPFEQLRLTSALEKMDWVGAPRVFTERLTAHLWSTRQIDSFRAAAVAHVQRSNEASPPAPLPGRRLVMVVIGQGVRESERRLFRKLRPHGVCFTNIRSGEGFRALLHVLNRRANSLPLPYGHWHIDGGAASPGAPGLTVVSYASLVAARAALQSRMQKIYEAAVFDPEAFRTRMAQIEPGEVGMPADGDSVLTRFELSLLTEGSGTQVFATTFVQWAAREALRRAEPMTLVARFSPRQRENPMNVLLAEAQRPPELDPEGSLVDADMGAYYTWLNQQRLAGAGQAAFLAWFEGHREAVAIGPGFDRGQTSDAATELKDLAARLA